MSIFELTRVALDEVTFVLCGLGHDGRRNTLIAGSIDCYHTEIVADAIADTQFDVCLTRVVRLGRITQGADSPTGAVAGRGVGRIGTGVIRRIAGARRISRGIRGVVTGRVVCTGASTGFGIGCGLQVDLPFADMIAA